MEASAANYAELAAQHAEENSKTFDELEEDKVRRTDRLERSAEYDAHVVCGCCFISFCGKAIVLHRGCCATRCPARCSRWRSNCVF